MVVAVCNRRFAMRLTSDTFLPTVHFSLIIVHSLLVLLRHEIPFLILKVSQFPIFSIFYSVDAFLNALCMSFEQQNHESTQEETKLFRDASIL